MASTVGAAPPPATAPSSPSFRMLAFGDLSTITQLSYLDYFFNPCSLISVEFSITADLYATKFAKLDRTTPLLMKVPIGSHLVTGQVVSFQTFKDLSSKTSPFKVSALLMPYGVAEPFTSPVKLSADTLTDGATITTLSTTLNVTRTFDKTLMGFKSTSSSVSPSLSLLGSSMLWRRQMTQDGFIAYQSKKNLSNADGLTFPHRLLYYAFGTEKNSSGTPSTNPVKGHAVLGDIDFASITGSRNFLEQVKKDEDTQVVFSSGSQGLLNAAFAYIPEVSNSYNSIVSAAVNETFTMDFSGRMPALASTFMFGPTTGPNMKSAGTFGRYIVSRTGLDVYPPWEEGKGAVHLKTMYSFTSNGMASEGGHRVQYVLGRLNPSLCPHGG